MQTAFTSGQLKDPHIAEANGILRTCVHCGFCLATCPTYVLLGDELDSPRGRIYLIKNMLEKGEAAKPETVKHIDRCLSCLACMTTCPSGVHYMHLIDQARVHVEETYRRPVFDRMLRNLLAFTMPRPGLFRLGLLAARLGRPLAPVFSALGGERIASLLKLVPKRLAPPQDLGTPGTYAAEGIRRGRVALLMGCVQSVLEPSINAATIRLLTRLGFEVVVAGEEACCGSLTHHMGKEEDALARARRSIDQWLQADVNAVVITASGCGTTIKEYGHMLRLDSAYAEKAKRISGMAKDISEFLAGAGLSQVKAPRPVRIAYHSACSLQHGQNIKTVPQALLRNAGFEVAEVPDGHLCCGSAGTYNILQPAIAAQLRDRKIANIESTRPDAIATGNIGCISQISGGTEIPILHTVELLDWAHGGPIPQALVRDSGER
jgi:glycolate dehydrogenase iron-sulfur subunit